MFCGFLWGRYTCVSLILDISAIHLMETGSLTKPQTLPIQLDCWLRTLPTLPLYCWNCRLILACLAIMWIPRAKLHQLSHLFSPLGFFFFFLVLNNGIKKSFSNKTLSLEILMKYLIILDDSKNPT